MSTTEQKPISFTSISSIKTSRLIQILIALLILAISFWAGMAVGYRKAEFSFRFSDNFVRNFGMHDRSLIPRNMMGMPNPDDLVSGHGAVGKVLSINLPTLIISDRDGVEKNITISADTIIRSARSTTTSTTIKADDFVVVIGTPNDNGSITAKLVRVMSSIPFEMSSSSPVDRFGGQRGPGMMRPK